MTDATPPLTFGNPPRPVAHVTDADGNHYCQIHTDRASELRCNRCTRYMCPSCATQTPVGYRCRECVRQQDDRFFNALPRDTLVVGVVGVVLAAPGAQLVTWIGWIIVAFFIGAGAAGLVSTVMVRAIQRRRGRHLKWAGALGVVLGTLAVLLAQWWLWGRADVDLLVPYLTAWSVPEWLYTAVAAAGVWARLRA